MGKILARGHSRVPVYSGNPKNVIGLLLVSSEFSPSGQVLIVILLLFSSDHFETNVR